MVIPNVYHAVEEGREKSTLGTMRTVATAVELYSIDHQRYPVAVSMLDLARVLEPTYVKSLATTDGWRNSFEYAAASDGQGYRIRSSMADGKWDVPMDGYVDGFNPCGDIDSDVVFDTGSFLRWPEGGCHGED